MNTNYPAKKKMALLSASDVVSVYLEFLSVENPFFPLGPIGPIWGTEGWPWGPMGRAIPLCGPIPPSWSYSAVGRADKGMLHWLPPAGGQQSWMGVWTPVG